MKKRKAIIWICAALFVCLVGFRIISSKRKAKVLDSDTSKPVYSQKVSFGTLQATINVSGNIVSGQQADIFPRVPGKLIKFVVQEGDYVRADQEIAMIDRDEVGISFSTATVKSPINGVVLNLSDIDPGAKVNPAMPIATVGNISSVRAVVNLPEKDFFRVKRGMRANINVDAYPGRIFSGDTVTVAPQIDMISRTGRVEILIDNSAQSLRPGMFATVKLVSAYHSGVIVIPRASVIEDGDARKVFVIENGKANEKLLTTGLFDDNNVEVTAGLNEGEELVIDGQRGLKNGDTVRVVSQ